MPGSPTTPTLDRVRPLAFGPVLGPHVVRDSTARACLCHFSAVSALLSRWLGWARISSLVIADELSPHLPGGWRWWDRHRTPPRVSAAAPFPEWSGCRSRPSTPTAVRRCRRRVWHLGRRANALEPCTRGSPASPVG